MAEREDLGRENATHQAREAVAVARRLMAHLADLHAARRRPADRQHGRERVAGRVAVDENFLVHRTPRARGTVRGRANGCAVALTPPARVTRLFMAARGTAAGCRSAP